MSNIPSELKYVKSHEWVRVEGTRAVLGITDHAQQALNDVVYVDTPKVGQAVKAGEAFAVVESVKSVSDIYAAVSGTVVDVNGILADNPESINQEPYGKGWIAVIEMSDPKELDKLLDAAGYRSVAGE